MCVSEERGHREGRKRKENKRNCDRIRPFFLSFFFCPILGALLFSVVSEAKGDGEGEKGRFLFNVLRLFASHGRRL